MAEAATLKLDLGTKQQAKPSQEDEFRDVLGDVQGIVEKLSPICATWEELVNLLKSARENDAALKLVLAACK